MEKADWGEIELKKAVNWYGADFCSHKIWLDRKKEILSVICEDAGALSAAERKKPPRDRKNADSAPSLSHFRISSAADRILFAPHLPDRGVVISHPDMVYILPGERLQAFCLLPLSVALYELPGSRLIHEYPTVKLSKTLFGETDSGEILYSYPSSLSTARDELEQQPVEVLCPLEIRNNSAEKLVIKRLCIRVKLLSIYKGKGNGRLFTDMVVFNVKTQTMDSQISIRPWVPEASWQKETVMAARLSNSGRLMQKSFDFFKAIGQL